MASYSQRSIWLNEAKRRADVNSTCLSSQCSMSLMDLLPISGRPDGAPWLDGLGAICFELDSGKDELASAGQIAAYLDVSPLRLVITRTDQGMHGVSGQGVVLCAHNSSAATAVSGASGQRIPDFLRAAIDELESVEHGGASHHMSRSPRAVLSSGSADKGSGRRIAVRFIGDVSESSTPTALSIYTAVRDGLDEAGRLYDCLVAFATGSDLHVGLMSDCLAAVALAHACAHPARFHVLLAQNDDDPLRVARLGAALAAAELVSGGDNESFEAALRGLLEALQNAGESIRAPVDASDRRGLSADTLAAFARMGRRESIGESMSYADSSPPRSTPAFVPAPDTIPASGRRPTLDFMSAGPSPRDVSGFHLIARLDGSLSDIATGSPYPPPIDTGRGSGGYLTRPALSTGRLAAVAATGGTGPLSRATLARLPALSRRVLENIGAAAASALLGSMHGGGGSFTSQSSLLSSSISMGPLSPVLASWGQHGSSGSLARAAAATRTPGSGLGRDSDAAAGSTPADGSPGTSISSGAASLSASVPPSGAFPLQPSTTMVVAAGSAAASVALRGLPGVLALLESAQLSVDRLEATLKRGLVPGLGAESPGGGSSSSSPSAPLESPQLPLHAFLEACRQLEEVVAKCGAGATLTDGSEAHPQHQQRGGCATRPQFRSAGGKAPSLRSLRRLRTLGDDDGDENDGGSAAAAGAPREYASEFGGLRHESQGSDGSDWKGSASTSGGSPFASSSTGTGASAAFPDVSDGMATYALRARAEHLMTRLLIGSGALTALTRVVSLEARARDAFLKAQEELEAEAAQARAAEAEEAWYAAQQAAYASYYGEEATAAGYPHGALASAGDSSSSGREYALGEELLDDPPGSNPSEPLDVGPGGSGRIMRVNTAMAAVPPASGTFFSPASELAGRTATDSVALSLGSRGSGVSEGMLFSPAPQFGDHGLFSPAGVTGPHSGSSGCGLPPFSSPTLSMRQIAGDASDDADVTTGGGPRFPLPRSSPEEFDAAISFCAPPGASSSASGPAAPFSLALPRRPAPSPVPPSRPVSMRMSRSDSAHSLASAVGAAGVALHLPPAPPRVAVDPLTGMPLHSTVRVIEFTKHDHHAQAPHGAVGHGGRGTPGRPGADGGVSPAAASLGTDRTPPHGAMRRPSIAGSSHSSGGDGRRRSVSPALSVALATGAVPVTPVPQQPARRRLNLGLSLQLPTNGSSGLDFSPLDVVHRGENMPVLPLAVPRDASTAVVGVPAAAAAAAIGYHSDSDDDGFYTLSPRQRTASTGSRGSGNGGIAIIRSPHVGAAASSSSSVVSGLGPPSLRSPLASPSMSGTRIPSLLLPMSAKKGSHSALVSPARQRHGSFSGPSSSGSGGGFGQAPLLATPARNGGGGGGGGDGVGMTMQSPELRGAASGLPPLAGALPLRLEGGPATAASSVSATSGSDSRPSTRDGGGLGGSAASVSSSAFFFTGARGPSEAALDSSVGLSQGPSLAPSPFSGVHSESGSSTPGSEQGRSRSGTFSNDHSSGSTGIELLRDVTAGQPSMLPAKVLPLLGLHPSDAHPAIASDATDPLSAGRLSSVGASTARGDAGTAASAAVNAGEESFDFDLDYDLPPPHPVSSLRLASPAAARLSIRTPKKGTPVLPLGVGSLQPRLSFPLPALSLFPGSQPHDGSAASSSSSWASQDGAHARLVDGSADLSVRGWAAAAGLARGSSDASSPGRPGAVGVSPRRSPSYDNDDDGGASSAAGFAVASNPGDTWGTGGSNAYLFAPHPSLSCSPDWPSALPASTGSDLSSTGRFSGSGSPGTAPSSTGLLSPPDTAGGVEGRMMQARGALSPPFSGAEGSPPMVLQPVTEWDAMPVVTVGPPPLSNAAHRRQPEPLLSAVNDECELSSVSLGAGETKTLPTVFSSTGAEGPAAGNEIATPSSALAKLSYLQARWASALYRCPQAHTAVLMLAFTCLVTPAGTSIRKPVLHRMAQASSNMGLRLHQQPAARATSGPTEGAVAPSSSSSSSTAIALSEQEQRFRRLFDGQPVHVLHTHVNHPLNLGTVNVHLRAACAARGPAFMRILRLLSFEFFVPGHYELGGHIASGAYGTVVAGEADESSPAAATLQGVAEAVMRAAAARANTAAASGGTGSMGSATPEKAQAPPLLTRGAALPTGSASLAGSTPRSMPPVFTAAPDSASSAAGGGARALRLKLRITDRADTIAAAAAAAAAVGSPSSLLLRGETMAPQSPASGLGVFTTAAGSSPHASDVPAFDSDATTGTALPHHAIVIPGLEGFAALPSPTSRPAVAVKLVSFPSDPLDRCVVSQVLPEVAVLEELTRRWVTAVTGPTAASAASGSSSSSERAAPPPSALTEGCPVVCLLDYGVTPWAVWLVMERCESSLGGWRRDGLQAALPGASPRSRLITLLHLVQAVAARVDQLHGAGVAHYDLKADNVLLRSGARAAIAAHARALDAAHSLPPESAVASHAPTWRALLPYVCVADFGESDFRPDLPAHSRPLLLGRGTECIKAPELLRAARARGRAAAAAAAAAVAAGRPGSNDPSADEDEPGAAAAVAAAAAGGASAALGPPPASACDVWSVGCLLYELAAGRYLYQDDDWARFFLSVTGDTHPARTGTGATEVGGAAGGGGGLEAQNGMTLPLPLLPPERVELLEGQYGPAASGVLGKLLTAVLVRDAFARPPAHAVVELVEGALGDLAAAAAGMAAPHDHASASST